MALFEDIFEGWSTGGLLGVGAVLAAPTLVPLVGATLRPVAQGLGQGFLVLTDTVRGLVGTAGEGMRELADGQVTDRAVDEGEEAESRANRTRERRETQARAKRKNELRASKPRNRAVARRKASTQRIAA